ncbi:MAG: histidine triad nucleotide-binding protein [Aquificaceae bacterium]|nr:histidine triad nucleotide-binding protein [Aquificaceae bacterium]MDW8236916.1 histidine triad nucleotide-binding protein [Aquificaceae bacterium]
MSLMECIFCKILRKEIPSKEVYSDDLVYAFEDINPVAPVHILIIPRKHIEGLDKLSQEDIPIIGHLLYTAKLIANRLGLDPSSGGGGYRIVSNCGKDAGQSVYHIHFHLIAKRQLGWPPG